MKIANETIKKLTAKELNDLGCFNIGIVPLKGEPKSRIKGFKTELHTETEIHYENENVRHEMVKTVDGWAYRMFDKHTSEYEQFVSAPVACAFIK
jgi:hypothetical protein